jgi:hypothetical protein
LEHLSADALFDLCGGVTTAVTGTASIATTAPIAIAGMTIRETTHADTGAS